uniref:Uncharacterized protein n=1 Tax=Phoenicopteridae parvo-like hybrid virus TaxID=2794528 RepID=A0A8A4XD54_9VIRU|nr:MAG: hypothetical protein [Phoenicopteridae parvo-like hybrid virus]
MPGGSHFRRWYAARNAMRERGTWRGGDQPTHSVPATEEGEPPAQRPRTEEPSTSDSPDSLPELENSPTAEGEYNMSSTNGFSVLAWVSDSNRLTNRESDLSEENKNRITKELLLDFCCLVGMRWNMEITILTIDGTMYAFGRNTRFGMSDRTLKNALGNLSNYVTFIRGSPESTAEDLARFKVCKEKWQVPEQTSDSASGWDPSEPASTSTLIKRKRF